MPLLPERPHSNSHSHSHSHSHSSCSRKMVDIITSNSNLPPNLNTEAKQLAFVRQLVRSHLGDTDTIKQGGVKSCKFQGRKSRTFTVNLRSGEEAVVQLRVMRSRLELGKIDQARIMLGDRFVPEVRRMDGDELEGGLVPYYMTRIPGKTWFEARDEWTSSRPECAVMAGRFLGRILSGCVLASMNSAAVVESVIVPKLRGIWASSRDEIRPFRQHAEWFLQNIDVLKRLPLAIVHADLNSTNIMVDVDTGEVKGIVGWEEVAERPFGMGLDRIQDLAGSFMGHSFVITEGFEDVERAFWGELFSGVSVSVKELLIRNLDGVQMAVNLGSFLSTLSPESDDLNPAHLKMLPRILSYRIPQLRGQRKPYAI